MATSNSILKSCLDCKTLGERCHCLNLELDQIQDVVKAKSKRESLQDKENELLKTLLRELWGMLTDMMADESAALSIKDKIVITNLKPVLDCILK